MRPLFTIHAGEFLVGAHIESHFKRVNVWIPLRDTGVDLLVSDRDNRRAVSLQVKFSKDFLVTHLSPALQKELRARGWWTINPVKLRDSTADYWVFVLQGFASRSTDFVVVPRDELLRRFKAIHGRLGQKLHSHLCVTESDRCWEARGLSQPDLLGIAHGTYTAPDRDFSKWLNNWTPITRLDGGARRTKAGTRTRAPSGGRARTRRRVTAPRG